ncbi:MAG: hypothetical protein ICV74_11750, partial [Thermoleophilia bacterium]|nr:hypothetical protein [Thermoleophilia bacterium]
AIRVPFIVRYDRLGRGGRAEDRLVTNADVAPTLAALAGVPRPRSEGRDLRPLLAGRQARWRTSVLLENQGGLWANDAMPSYCGVRSDAGKYVLYDSDEEELYDLADDPYELENRVADRDYRADRRLGLATVRRLCFPTPPGYQPAKLCSLRGSARPTTIAGTRRADYVCSRSLRDRIYTAGGADTVYAAAASVSDLARATFTPGAPWAKGGRVATGSGNDRVLARNGRNDAVDCGAGSDVLVADRFDAHNGCEVVRFPFRR